MTDPRFRDRQFSVVGSDDDSEVGRLREVAAAAAELTLGPMRIMDLEPWGVLRLHRALDAAGYIEHAPPVEEEDDE